MKKHGRLFCFGCAISIALMTVNPIYAVPEETVKTETQSDTEIDESKEKEENADEELEEISIDEETSKINISESAINSYKELQKTVKEDKLEEYDYSEVAEPSDESVTTGDIMVRDNDIFICIKLNKTCTWWGLSEDTLQYKADVKLDEGDKVYRKTMKQTAYPEIEGLVGYNGELLTTVTLPQNYKWINENTLMTSVGKREYPAMYIPEDFINEKASITWIEVEVKPHQASPEIGNKYTVKYVPHLTAQMVGIPEGWKINSTEELKMGDNDVVISYTFPDGTTDHEHVTITVEKGDMNIQGVMITVIENTKLTNDILPQITNGKLEFESGLNKVVSENTTLTCTFNPNDVEHYNSTYEIPVIINVVPQAIIKSLQSSNNAEQNVENNETKTSETETNKNTNQTNATTETAKDTEAKKDGITVNSETQKKPESTEAATTTATTEKTTESSKKEKTTTSSTKKKTSSKKKTKSNTSSTSTNTTTSNSGTTKVKDLSLNTTKTTEATTESKKTSSKKSSKKTDIKNLEGSKTNDSSTTGNTENKIQMKDIDLTKKKTDGGTETKKQSNNESGKLVVETIDLTKQKSTEKSVIRDDSTSEATSEVITESTTEEKTTAENTENKKDNKKEKKTTKGNNVFGNKILLIFVGIVGVVFAGLIIFVIKIIQRNRMR